MTVAATDTPLIRLNRLQKTFGAQPILDNITLDIARGEKVVILGPSGCGKSTLLRCLNGLLKPDGGLAEVDGCRLDTPSNDFDMAGFRSRVALVFQQYNLFPHLTVMENLLLAPRMLQGRQPGTVQQEASHLLARVGLADKANDLPTTLSGGQQQRVAIARALLMQPEILLLDEPTSALDPLMSSEVLRIVEDCLAERGTTLVMVSHEVGFARRVADRIVFLDAGRLLANQPVTPFFESSDHPPAIARYLSAVRNTLF
ncbi:MAG: amino acid ABC transporter ATP-binding protein [Candidatus Melainabacteria bacterium]